MPAIAGNRWPSRSWPPTAPALERSKHHRVAPRGRHALIPGWHSQPTPTTAVRR
jgi:hypothetical protein